MEKFSPEVKEALGYYVYRLVDPRNGFTFYVGKGKGSRVLSHIENPSKVKKAEDILAQDSEPEDSIDLKADIIASIKNEGLNPLVIIHRHALDENSAFEVEAALIDAYPGLSNIQCGRYSSDYGCMSISNVISTYKSREEVSFPPDKRILLIFISLAEHHIDRVNLYERVRYAWRLSKKRASQADLILAVRQGIVAGVYRPLEWKHATTTNFPGLPRDYKRRYGFVGEEANMEDASKFLNKRIPREYRQRGAANPIRYINM